MLPEMYEYRRELVAEQPEKYRVGTRMRVLMGALFSAADYLRAQRLRARLAREVAAIFEQVDAIIFPGQSDPARALPH